MVHGLVTSMVITSKDRKFRKLPGFTDIPENEYFQGSCFQKKKFPARRGEGSSRLIGYFSLLVARQCKVDICFFTNRSFAILYLFLHLSFQVSCRIFSLLIAYFRVFYKYVGFPKWQQSVFFLSHLEVVRGGGLQYGWQPI